MNLKKNISNTITKKTYFIIGFFCLVCFQIIAQDQKLSDSLIKIYKSGEYEKNNELKILREIAQSETDADKILTYSLLLIVAAKTEDSLNYEFSGYLQKGNSFKLKGDLTKALESYFDASKIAKIADLKSDEAAVNIAIADVYSIMGDSDNSFKYYRDGLKIMEKVSDPLELAYAQFNFGDEYLIHKELDSALYYFNKASVIFDKENDDLGKAYILGNVGLVYAEKDDNEKAEGYLNSAVEVLTELEDYYGISVYLNAMSDIYEERNNQTIAAEYAIQSLNLAEKYGLKDQLSDSYQKLSSIYEKDGDIKKSFEYYKNHIIYRDSVNNIRTFQQMANERTDHEVSQKQMEVDLLSEQKKTQRIIAIAIGIALFFIAILAYALYKRNKYVVKTSKIIEHEKKRSDDLLKNILPDETALELKEKGRVMAKKFDSVSVLFTDFKGFTEYSESLNPEELVESIDYYFSKFDAIIEKHDLEKIKTVGDAYMCAGGLPFPDDDHAYRISLAAFDIVDFVRDTMTNDDHKLAKFDIRVGINTGPVVAGVVGTKKFSYDIWGDTVNLASRMESSGEIGKVNISQETYKLLQHRNEFEFISRGDVEAKGKGKVQMYFVQPAQ